MLESHQNISSCFGENCVKGIEKKETDLLGHSAVSDFLIFHFFFFASSCCHNQLPQTQWLKSTQIDNFTALYVRSLTLVSLG